MNENAKKLLEALYERAKKISTAQDFTIYPYQLSEILTEIGIKLEDFGKELKNNPYWEFIESDGIKLTPKGLEYCLGEFDQKPIGFIGPGSK